MCRVSSNSLRRISLEGLRMCGVLFFFAGSVFRTLCHSFAASNVPLSQWSIMKSGYVWMRSNMTTSWCTGRNPCHSEVLHDAALDKFPI